MAGTKIVERYLITNIALPPGTGGPAAGPATPGAENGIMVTAQPLVVDQAAPPASASYQWHIRSPEAAANFVVGAEVELTFSFPAAAAPAQA